MSDVDDALARLPQYNSRPYNGSTNPYGLPFPGYVQNFPQALSDVALAVGSVVGSVSEAASSASSAAASAENASDSADAASTSETNAANSASAAATSETNAAASEDAARSSAEMARSAAEASGDIAFYDTFADASADLVNLSEGQVVGVWADENYDDQETRYRVESAALVYKLAVHAVVDEDDMASDSPTKVPTQQSVKAYVDALGIPLISPGDAYKQLFVKSDDSGHQIGKPAAVNTSLFAVTRAGLVGAIAIAAAFGVPLRVDNDISFSDASRIALPSNFHLIVDASITNLSTSDDAGMFSIAPGSSNILITGKGALLGPYTATTPVPVYTYPNCNGCIAINGRVANPAIPDDAPCENIIIAGPLISGWGTFGVFAENTVGGGVFAPTRITKCGRDGIRKYGVDHFNTDGLHIASIKPGLDGVAPLLNAYGITNTRRADKINEFQWTHNDLTYSEFQKISVVITANATGGSWTDWIGVRRKLSKVEEFGASAGGAITISYMTDITVDFPTVKNSDRAGIFLSKGPVSGRVGINVTDLTNTIAAIVVNDTEMNVDVLAGRIRQTTGSMTAFSFAQPDSGYAIRLDDGFKFEGTITRWVDVAHIARIDPSSPFLDRRHAFCKTPSAGTGATAIGMSVSKSATGVYDYTLVQAVSSANYAQVQVELLHSSSARTFTVTWSSTTSFTERVCNSTGTAVDNDYKVTVRSP
jgi:hypothetical protein